MSMDVGKYALHKNFPIMLVLCWYYAGIMLDALPSYYAEIYAGIIGSSLIYSN